MIFLKKYRATFLIRKSSLLSNHYKYNQNKGFDYEIIIKNTIKTKTTNN